MSDFPPQSLRPFVEEVVTLLRERKETVSVGETAAGGIISATLLSIPGASQFFRGGLTLYTLESRVAFAGWTQANIDNYEGPSEEVVSGLARNVRKTLRSTYTLVESGTAGPTGGPARNRTPGYLAIAVSSVKGEVSKELNTGLGPDREKNMVAFAAGALKLLRDVIKGDAKLLKEPGGTCGFGFGDKRFQVRGVQFLNLGTSQFEFTTESQITPFKSAAERKRFEFKVPWPELLETEGHDPRATKSELLERPHSKVSESTSPYSKSIPSAEPEDTACEITATRASYSEFSNLARSRCSVEPDGFGIETPEFDAPVTGYSKGKHLGEIYFGSSNATPTGPQKTPLSLRQTKLRAINPEIPGKQRVLFDENTLEQLLYFRDDELPETADDAYYLDLGSDTEIRDDPDESWNTSNLFIPKFELYHKEQDSISQINDALYQLLKKSRPINSKDASSVGSILYVYDTRMS
ncbi:MAG: hypothetical protein MMC33_003678 [Icmadophila ericetorum]|nr:hypothetical protein [Icmadophila ericetorum]